MSSFAPSSRADHPRRTTLADTTTQPLPRALSPATPRVVRIARPTRRSASPRQMAVLHRSLLPLLVAVFALLNAGDLISTYIGLAGGMREANPLMSWLFTQFGFGALILYKLVVIAAVGAGILFLCAFQRRMAYITIWICNLLVLGVVISNLLQFTVRR